MIYSKLPQLGSYKGICPALDTAIDFLLNNDLSALKPGRNEIDGDRVFINRFDYTTLPENECAWEAHDAYGDMHILIAGREQIGVSDRSELSETVHRPENDFHGFRGPVRHYFRMEENDALIVFPEDVHMVKMQLGEPAGVSRLVVKFKLQ